jgi:hypothetical protein
MVGSSRALTMDSGLGMVKRSRNGTIGVFLQATLRQHGTCTEMWSVVSGVCDLCFINKISFYFPYYYLFFKVSLVVLGM